MKPVILITNKLDADPVHFGVGRICSIRSNYCRAIIRAGGIPVISAMGDAEDYAEMADGVLFSGGSNDIEPSLYREENRDARGCDLEIDEMELRIFDAFYKREKPMLGICRGIQLINVALGGTLVQHISAEISPLTVHAEGKTVHPVKAVPDSLFHNLFGAEFLTNSYHHEAVKECGRGLRATVTTEDGVIEAIEHETLPIFAAQWHPERMVGEEMADLPDMMPLFSHFVNCCRK